jgi:hypothetical protein
MSVTYSCSLAHNHIGRRPRNQISVGGSGLLFVVFANPQQLPFHVCAIAQIRNIHPCDLLRSRTAAGKAEHPQEEG